MALINVLNSVLRYLTITGLNSINVRIPIPWTFSKRVKMWNHFSDSEVEGLKTEFVAQLDMARHRAGTPFIITRGLSTPEHNTEVGGVSDSAHLTGMAVDLACSDSRSRYLIVNGAIATGINRIGIYRNHVHLDVDTTKDPNVIWVSENV